MKTMKLDAPELHHITAPLLSMHFDGRIDALSGEFRGHCATSKIHKPTQRDYEAWANDLHPKLGLIA